MGKLQSKLLARDGSSPKNASVIYTGCEERSAVQTEGQSCFPNDAATPAIKLVAISRPTTPSPKLISRDASSPKNASVILTLADEAIDSPIFTGSGEINGTLGMHHGYSDESKNGRSDQRHRGGIGG